MRFGCLMIGTVLVAACGGVDSAVDSDAAWTLGHTTTDGVLLGVWGSSPTDVWAVGGQVDRSLVLHGDGKSWTAMEVSFPSLLYSVYGFSDSDVYAVGERGLILHFDGTAWTRVESNTERPLFGLWGASSDDVWIVGGDIHGPAGAAVVLRGAGGTFNRVDLPDNIAPSVLFKAHGTASDDVMMVGAGGTVLRSDGTNWRRDPVPTREPLFSTWGHGTDDVYAVGGRGAGEIIHFDGTQWSQVLELPTGHGLRGVFTSADGSATTVGSQYIFHIARDGSVSQAQLPELDSSPVLHGVWGDEAGSTYAVGGDLDAYPRVMSGVILSRR